MKKEKDMTKKGIKMRDSIYCGFLFIFLIFFTNIRANHNDSIINKVVDLKIGKSNNKYEINLEIENLKEDTIKFRSSFFLDDPTKMSYIIINRCRKEFYQKCDSTYKCEWGIATSVNTEPTIIKYQNNRTTSIPPKEKISIPILVPTNYYNYSIYLQVQILVLFENKLLKINQRTNYLYFGKE